MKYFLLATCLCTFTISQAQTDNLPVKVMGSNDATKPIIFYATGDGGWSKFSNALVQSFERDQFPLNTLTIRNYSSITIDGGHHFDDNAGKVAQQVLAWVK